MKRSQSGSHTGKSPSSSTSQSSFKSQQYKQSYEHTNMIRSLNDYIILDNGGGSIKYSRASDALDRPKVMSNCIARINKQMQVLVGDQVEDVLNGSLLRFTRPCDRGYLNNWGCEIEVWNRLFSKMFLNVNPSESSLVLTDAPLAPQSMQNDMNEVVFEVYGFREYMRRPAAWFSAYELSCCDSSNSSNSCSSSNSNSNSSSSIDNSNHTSNTHLRSCCTVIDSGFSFSHVFPFIDNVCQKHAIKRLNVGGKLLTNHLKTVISYRQYHMMEEYKLINDVKEKLCYISNDIYGELKESQLNKRGVYKCNSDGIRKHAKDPFGDNMKKLYVLPDFHTIPKGYVKSENEIVLDGRLQPQDEQLLVMETERFSIPEVLFKPSDIEMNQAGIAEATWQSFSTLNPLDLSLACTNIVLTGGNCNLPQFSDRFYSEVRSNLPDTYQCKVVLPVHPEEYAWKGANRFVLDNYASTALSACMVTKEQYLEYGHEYCNEKFYDSW